MTQDKSDQPANPARRLRGSLENVQLMVTIVIAVLSAWLTVQQHDIKTKLEQQQQEHAERLAVTEQSIQLLERAKDYLEKLDLDEKKSQRILIALLDIEKDIRMSLTGEISEQGVRKQVDLLPLHLALLTNESETLAHLGGSAKDLDRWLPVAEASGDVAIRKVAIESLKKIGELSNDKPVVAKAVDSIIALTRRWSSAELTASGLDAIAQILDVHPIASLKLGDDTLSALRELEGTIASSGGETGGVASAESGSASGGVDTDQDLSTAQRDQERLLANKLEVVRSSRLRYESSQGVDRSEASNGEEVSKLIGNLESDDTATRRLARSKLADLKERAIKPIFEALGQDSPSYRRRLGVVTALMLMSQPLKLEPAQIEMLVPLLGDPDKTVRTNTAQFLGQSTDKETILSTIEVLKQQAMRNENHANANYIYNCVIVFVDWLRWNEYVTGNQDLSSKINSALTEIKEVLEKDGDRWRSTLSQLENGLKLSGG